MKINSMVPLTGVICFLSSGFGQQARPLSLLHTIPLASSLSQAPPWSAFDIRMMFQGYLERGFVAEAGDVETLTEILGHRPRRYEDFARETAALWKA